MFNLGGLEHLILNMLKVELLKNSSHLNSRDVQGSGMYSGSLRNTEVIKLLV